jgi:hypothetical protein
MRRSVPSAVAVVSLLGLAGACGNTAPTTASTPVPIVDTHTQVLGPNGAIVFPFTEVQAGAVVATLTTISPDSALTLQLDLGTWDGAACTLVVTASPAVQGSSASGTANGSGQLCARVSDPNGLITSSESITVTISHF